MSRSIVLLACALLAIVLFISPVAAQERGGGICREAGRDIRCPRYRFWREFGFYEYREYDPHQHSIAAAVVAPAGGRGGIPHRALAVAAEHLVSYVRGNNTRNETVGAEFPVSIEWFTYNHTYELYIVEIWLHTENPPVPNDPRLFVLTTNEDSVYFAQRFSEERVPTDEEIARHAREFQLELIIREELFVSGIHTVSFYERFETPGRWTKEILYYAVPLRDGADAPKMNTHKAFQHRTADEWFKMAIDKF